MGIITSLVVGAVAGALSSIGFTTGGVAAGSVAAGIQAGIGNVAAGSLFATAQSLGATSCLILLWVRRKWAGIWA